MWSPRQESNLESPVYQTGAVPRLKWTEVSQNHSASTGKNGSRQGSNLQPPVTQTGILPEGSAGPCLWTDTFPRSTPELLDQMGVGAAPADTTPDCRRAEAHRSPVQLWHPAQRTTSGRQEVLGESQHCGKRCCHVSSSSNVLWPGSPLQRFPGEVHPQRDRTTIRSYRGRRSGD